MKVSDAILFPEIVIWPEAKAYLYDNTLKARRELYTVSGSVSKWVSAEDITTYYDEGQPIARFGTLRKTVELRKCWGDKKHD